MVSRKFKRIKVRVRTPISKTGNGAFPGGKINNLLLIGTNGDNGNDGKRYLVKGLRGLLNHSMMAIAEQYQKVEEKLDRIFSFLINYYTKSIVAFGPKSNEDYFLIG